MRILYVGVLGSQRHREFMRGMNSYSSEISANYIDYLDIVSNGKSLLDPKYENMIVRLDATAQSFLLEKELLKLGFEEAKKEGVSSIGAPAVDIMRENRGEFRFPSQYYFGFKKLMKNLQVTKSQAKSQAWLMDPVTCSLLFDKEYTSNTYQEINIPVPQTIKNCCSFSELYDYMRNNGTREVYVKHRYGSTACGIACLRLVGNQVYCISTMKKVNGIYYNVLQLNTMRDSNKIEHMIDYLFNEKVVIEKSIKKCSIDGIGFDCRFIVIKRKVEFIILRKSNKPFTNLHFGAERDTYNRLLEILPKWLIDKAIDTCIVLANLHQQLLLGIDVVFHSNKTEFSVLESNAFGGFFPNLRRNGKTVLDYEIDALRTYGME